jgi:hypothetical protein
MISEDVMGKWGTSHRGGDFAVKVRQLPDLFDSVTEFTAVALATHDRYGNIVHSVKQTYKAVCKLGSTSSIATTPPTISTTSNNPTRAAILSHPPSSTQDGATLRQVKVQVTDLTEHKTIRETANATILQRVVRRTENVGVSDIKRFSSGDLVIQLQEQAGKEVLSGVLHG